MIARMDPSKAHVIAMYDRHPISAEQILARLTRQRGSLDGLAPADLFDHDQDHYGGLDANLAIAARARLRAGERMVGLGAVVDMIEGDVTAAPLDDDCADSVIS